MFVGIDVSKATLDVAILDAGQTRSSRVANTPDAITALASELAAVTPTLVVLEATGVYHLALLAALVQADLPVSLVNPLQVKGFRQTLGRRTKTDRVDAQVLATFAQQYAEQLRRWTPAPAVQQELADWMTYRDQVVDTITRLRNQLKRHATEGAAPSWQRWKRIWRMPPDNGPRPMPRSGHCWIRCRKQRCCWR